MKKKVFDLLKPKAASFGFNEDELMTVSESIAGSLGEEATDEMIDKAVNQFLPILGLSQKASQRIFANLKAQFEKDHPTPPTPPAPPKKEKPSESTDSEVAELLKKLKEDHDNEMKSLREQVEKMTKERASEVFNARAVAGLNGVDEKFYGLMLKGREFKSNEEVDSFVSEVKAGWDELCKARNISEQSKVTPPGSGQPGEDKPSQAVLDRIAERNEQAKTATSPIRGIESK